MAIPTLSGSYIDETYQRLVQVSGGEYADGLGNPISFGTTSTGSLLTTASVSLNTITFTKGNGDQFNITIDTGSAAIGTYYNTATGSYGSFYDTGSYTATSATTIYSMSLSTTDISNGVYVSGSDKTRIYVSNTGVYNVQFSAQFTNSDNVGVDVAIWLRKNDNSSTNDLADSTGICTVPPRKGSTNGQTISGWNYYVNVAAGDFIELLWHSATANVVTLETIAAGTNPVHPRTPSLIATVQRVDTFLSNTGSFSGSFIGNLIGNLEGTASWATNFVSASNYVLNTQTGSFVTNSQTSSFITYLQTGSFATTGSNTFSGSQTITGSVNIAGQTNFNNAVAVNDSNLNLTNSSSLNLTSGSSIFINNGLFVVTGSTLVNISGEVNVNNAVAVNDSNVNLTNSSSLNLTSGSSIFVDSGSLTVTNGGITGSLYNEAFSKNRTTPTSINTIKQYQSIFNPSNLFIGENDIFIVEQNSEYYVLGDVVNSGSMVVDGTFKIGGALLNDGNITGIGIIE